MPRALSGWSSAIGAAALCAGLAGCQRGGDPACLQAAEQWRTRENADLNAKILMLRRRHDVLTYEGLPGKSSQDCSAPSGICVERAPRDAKEKEAFALRERALKANDLEVAKILGAALDDGKSWRVAINKAIDEGEAAQAGLGGLEARYQAKVQACRDSAAR